MTTTVERFMTKVQIQENGCWKWMSSVDKRGYGSFWIDGDCKFAHRVSYALFVRPIEKGQHICHTCDNKWCVNPSHLFSGSRIDNMQDALLKGRLNRRRADRHGSVTHPEKLVRGEAHPQAKITEKIVLAIRADQRSHARIARDFGLHRSTVSFIKSGRLWAHIGNPSTVISTHPENK